MARDCLKLAAIALEDSSSMELIGAVVVWRIEAFASAAYRVLGGDMNRDLRAAVAAVSLALLLLPPLASAQMAPTGDHYGGKPSDTGTLAGSVNASGGYSQSIPISMPSARGGIPIPFQIVFGSRGVGAAGLGWDIPLSFVRKDSTLADHKPRYEFPKAGGAPTTRDRYTVTLDGETLDLVPHPAGTTTTWVAQHDATELSVQQVTDHWVMYDGNGLTYTFSVPANTPSLSGQGIWLLTSIKGPDGATLNLGYMAPTVALDGGSAVAIDLTNITYNPNPTNPSCFKNQIVLTYDNKVADPYTLSVLNNLVLARVDKLLTVAVDATASCGAPAALRTYTMHYDGLDLDTAQPRLSSVTMVGQAGTAELSQTLPVASFKYGNISDGTTVNYVQTQTIPLSGISDQGGISTTVQDGTWQAPADGQVTYSTWQELTDVTGDGRPDLVTKGTGGDWNVLVNQADGNGATKFSAPVQLTDSTLRGTLPFERLALGHTRYGAQSITSPFGENEQDVWRQAIDVNGDGRIDIVDAAEVPGSWVIYLNTNGTNSASFCTPVATGHLDAWVRKVVNVQNVADALSSRGHIGVGTYVPLARHSTGRNYSMNTCVSRASSTSPWQDAGICPGQSQSMVSSHEMTFTEWELKDVNGDGFPDLVINSSPTKTAVHCSPTGGGAGNGPVPGICNGSFDLRDNYNNGVDQPSTTLNNVDIMLNMAGMRLETAAPTTYLFHAPGRLLNRNACGVEKWEAGTNPLDGNHSDIDQTQIQTCVLADINGDGLLDRVDQTTVRLGTGRIVGLVGGADVAFTSINFKLPAQYGTNFNSADAICGRSGSGPTTSTKSGISAAMRDLNGDGIPDYIVSATAGWQVQFGTGSGFGPVRALSGMTLSLENELCSGSPSTTVGGLYDIDGDGKPELAAFDNTVSPPVLHISQLKQSHSPTIGVPEAGHLVAVDNGYGERTTILYRSAKEDRWGIQGGYEHMVPFPEIVVSQIQTFGLQGLGGNLNATQYAYTGATLKYDSTHERFRLPAYARRIELTSESTDSVQGAPPQQQQPPGQYVATFYDSLPSAAYQSGSTNTFKYNWDETMGRISDVTTVVGSGRPDPWTMLGLQLRSAPGVIGSTHYNWTSVITKESPINGGTDSIECFHLMCPYDFNKDLGEDFTTADKVYDVCSDHGFSYINAVSTWRGDQAPPSTNNVQTVTTVDAVDAYGHATAVTHQNDLSRTDDDYCVQTTFAVPSGTNERFLAAPATVATTSACNNPSATVYASESFAYDELAVGSISSGHLTRVLKQRRNADTGALLGTITAFDVAYDSAGNASSLVENRDDGVTRTTTVDHDSFGLVPTHFRVTSSNTPALDTFITIDPLTLATLSSTDPNGTIRGMTFDGFNREVLSTITPPSGATGVLAKMSYLGFQGGDPLGRRVISKEFTDPVTAANVDTAAGRTATTFFDELGRERMTQVALGADYANETLIMGARSYDPRGRVAFEADLYPASQDQRTAYGTTHYFRADGSEYLSIRGAGPQAATFSPDPSKELFPTAYSHSFSNSEEWVGTQEADSLTPGSPQAGVARAAAMSAIGKVLLRQTFQGSTWLETIGFTFDHLGQLKSMSRYNTNGAIGAMTTVWQKDSLGQVLQLEDPFNALQTRTYNSFGDLTGLQWSATNEPTHSVLYSYDGLDRLTHSEERNGGEPDATTTKDFSYDTPVVVSPEVIPTFTSGRMAKAISPTGAVAFSYDAFGRVNARSFTDPAARYYVEKYAYHGDGTTDTLSFALPDNSHSPEVLTYGYDSAGRMHSMLLSSGTSTVPLFQSSAIDPFGRILGASFLGGTSYAATYEVTGRRLFQDMTVRSASGYRKITAGGTFSSSGTRYAYDPVGRLNSQQESNAATSDGPYTQYTYDALGRLNTSVQKDQGGAATLSNWSFLYDSLGNAMTLSDNLGTSDGKIAFQMTPGTQDREHICQMAYGDAGTNNLGCTVKYDGIGNIVSMPSRTGTRTLGWYNSGQPKSVSDTNGASATFKYDAFGAIQELNVAGSNSPDQRQDRNYGGLLAWHNVAGTGPVLTRTFPGPGVNITRRGPTNSWVFAFGETRGGRFMTNQAGAFVQDVSYTPFGQPLSSGAQPDTAQYSSGQWNGGDALAALGLSQLGARLYDPVIGRFMSRDPLVLPRTGATTNPYAFAFNDPINSSDPTGFDPPVEGEGPPPDDGLDDAPYEGSEGVDSGPRTRHGEVGPTPSFSNFSCPDPVWQARKVADRTLTTSVRIQVNEVIARANRLSAAAVYEILVAKRDELLTKSPLQMALEGIWQEGVDTFQAGSDYFQGVRTAGNQVIDEIAGGNVSATEAMQNLDRLQNAEARLKFHILANVGPSLIAHGGAAVAAEAIEEITEAEAEQGIATVFKHKNGHYSIFTEVGEDELHTHQAILEDNATRIEEWEGRLEIESATTFELPNGRAALNYQRSMLNTDTGAYELMQNSCARHPGLVLQEGGISKAPVLEPRFSQWLEKQ
jgi:RHS repeat-associated protein